MKNNFSGYLYLIGATSAMFIAAVIGNGDISLLVALCTITLFAICGKKSAMPATNNSVLLLAVFLFLILLTYRVMFNILEVQLYIADDLRVRRTVTFYGGLLIQSLIIGGISGFFITQKKRVVNFSPNFNVPSFNYLLVVAWLPLVANLILYLFFFRGRAYVDLHTMSNGYLGLILKSIYLTYGSIILMALGTYSSDKAFKSSKQLLAGFLVIYGFLLNLRSPLLFSILLFIYFFGKRFSTRFLVLSTLFTILLFSVVGIIRDQSYDQSGGVMAIIEPMFGLGEFADALRFAIERSEVVPPLWGMGIAGSFLGTTEPLANVYAKAISPDYFANGGGFGFFILADLVLNFGLINSFFVLFIVGMVLVRQYYSYGSIFPHVFLSAIFANMFALVRNDIGTTFRGIVYTVISVVVIKYIWTLIPVRSSKKYIFRQF